MAHRLGTAGLRNKQSDHFAFCRAYCQSDLDMQCCVKKTESCHAQSICTLAPNFMVSDYHRYTSRPTSQKGPRSFRSDFCLDSNQANYGSTCQKSRSNYYCRQNRDRRSCNGAPECWGEYERPIPKAKHYRLTIIPEEDGDCILNDRYGGYDHGDHEVYPKMRPLSACPPTRPNRSRDPTIAASCTNLVSSDRRSCNRGTPRIAQSSGDLYNLRKGNLEGLFHLDKLKKANPDYGIRPAGPFYGIKKSVIPCCGWKFCHYEP